VTAESPEPPFLVLRPEQAFWVESRRGNDWPATFQFFLDGSFRDLHCYDAAGRHWAIADAHLSSEPSFLQRTLFSHREVAVRVAYAPPRLVETREIVSRVESVLLGQSDFNDFLGAPPGDVLERFRRAASAREIIEIAAELGSRTNPVVDRRAHLRIAGVCAVTSALTFALGGVGFFSLALGVLALFFLASAALRAKPRNRGAPPPDSLAGDEYRAPAFGVLGTYPVDGDDCFGLFIELEGKPVLVDLRQDRWLEERKRVAQSLHEESAALAASFRSFVQDSDALRRQGVSKVRIVSIGLYAKGDPGLGEVCLVTGDGDEGWMCSLKHGRFDGLIHSQ